MPFDSLFPNLVDYARLAQLSTEKQIRSQRALSERIRSFASRELRSAYLFEERKVFEIEKTFSISNKSAGDGFGDFCRNKSHSLQPRSGERNDF